MLNTHISQSDRLNAFCKDTDAYIEGYSGGPLSTMTFAAKDIFDVSGAGDTVIATFAVFLNCGFNYEESANIANQAAGIVVSHPGTYPIDMKTLINGIN